MLRLKLFTTMPDLNYQVFRNGIGQVDAVNRLPDGATVPIADRTDPLTIELRAWETINGALDLSDHLVGPDVQIVVPSFLGFYGGLLSDAINLFLFVRYVSDLDLPVSNCYTDLMGSIQFQQLPGFQAAIANLSAAMTAAGYEFSAIQITQMRSLLDANGFKTIVFPLGS